MKEEHDHSMKKIPDGTSLLSYIKGTATPENVRIIENWLREDESHEKELLQIARIYYAGYTHDRILSRDPVSAYMNLQSRIRNKKRRIWLIRVAAVAACLAGVVILSYVLISVREQASDFHSQVITVQANAGMRTHFTLPDSTQVYLNSGSILSYPVPFDSRERRIMLNGEAYFRVTNNPEQPFIVNLVTNEMSVKVLGTEFNIDAYEKKELACATLVKGSISVILDKGNGVITDEILNPSEKAIYNKKEKKLAVRTVDTTHDTAWLHGVIIFKDSPFPEVLTKLSHFYNVEFEVKDKEIESYLFTGVFNNRQLSQVLSYLEISSGIKYTVVQNHKDDSEGINREKIILEKKR